LRTGEVYAAVDAADAPGSGVAEREWAADEAESGSEYLRQPAAGRQADRRAGSEVETQWLAPRTPRDKP
jgi:hypothetical protein